MNFNRLSNEMQEALIRQMTLEMEASQVYLAYGIWADEQGYEGVANFLYRHSHEERNHMVKFMQYIQERGGRPRVEYIKAPESDPSDLRNCFERIMLHEIKNTESIYRIVNTSMSEGDWATWNFAQYFVKEQIEEEKLILGLLDKLKVALGENESDTSLYEFNKDLGQLPDDVSLAREATSENPV